MTDQADVDVSGGVGQSGEDPRTLLAWLIWCTTQGYTDARDRAILKNWLLADPATLHPDDAALRPQLLEMADSVLEALTNVTGGTP